MLLSNMANNLQVGMYTFVVEKVVVKKNKLITFKLDKNIFYVKKIRITEIYELLTFLRS